ncbi:GNAT family N-acetyltransferase [Leifsonia sp. H3M29-4]|uniref:GNAT family N-acetyltransferase n=1 Tax=Salinibacterium metalliresistens TaxID=3031321 RepID=UPI0023DC3957|nr:GNAT family N-acetyltransferase [Salinibacterium metalliresistens]MDF1480418.1 GNAT family N-acetyltransferase [Salinibacterium metalliresistens]
MPTIRAYRPADEPSWLQCRLLSFFATDYYDDVKVAKTRLAPGSIELVAERDGEVVGILDVENDGDAATIDTLAVHPTAQRTGLASALLDAALAQLPPTVTTLDAWTREDAAANAWYVAAGFRETYRYLHVYVGDGDPTFPGPEGMSSPVIAFMHAPIEQEAELREAYRRVYVCRRFVRVV